MGLPLGRTPGASLSFLAEIKRRRVLQVAAAYAVVAWLVVQVVDVVNEPLSLPAAFDTVVIVLVAVGFPLALVLAWAFDLTPVGMVRTPAAWATVPVESAGPARSYPTPESPTCRAPPAIERPSSSSDLRPGRGRCVPAPA
jgi:hypothetical protein